MGMYTELIFGASFKKETPTQVIDALKYINGEIEEKPKKDYPTMAPFLTQINL
jgi:hypothetical protein